MRLLYLTEYFNTPDEGGLMRTWEISKFLADHGHDVSVIVPAAHHMTGEPPAAARGRLRWTYRVHGIEVTKVWTAARFRRGSLARLLHYLTSPIAILLASVGRKPDVIMCSSPPFFLVPGAFLLSRLKRIPFVLEVRDAWLEFALAKGLVPRGLGRLLLFQQAWLLRHADRVVSVTPGIHQIVLDTLPSSRTGRALLVMNGYEEDIFATADPKRVRQVAEEWGLDGRFLVVYAGTMGLARDCMTFVRAAARLQDESKILFVFLGEGERKRDMQGFVEAGRLTNCLFVPMQPRRDMPAWFAAAAVGLNSIKAGEALESSLSNKIFDYLGGGLPVVFSGGGDTREFLESSGGGVVVAAEDDLAMAAEIRRLHRDPELRARMGRQGRDFVVANYSRSKLVAPLEVMLRSLVHHDRQAIAS